MNDRARDLVLPDIRADQAPNRSWIEHALPVSVGLIVVLVAAAIALASLFSIDLDTVARQIVGESVPVEAPLLPSIDGNSEDR